MNQKMDQRPENPRQRKIHHAPPKSQRYAAGRRVRVEIPASFDRGQFNREVRAQRHEG